MQARVLRLIVVCTLAFVLGVGGVAYGDQARTAEVVPAVAMAQQQVTPSPTPTDEVPDIPPEVAGAEDQWPVANKDYANTRAAMGSQINAANVQDLGVAWVFEIPGAGPYGSAASNPLIISDTVFFQDLGSNVFALDLESGEVIWEQMIDQLAVGPNGPAVGWGKVFAHGGVNTLHALDMATGEELWAAELTGPSGAHQPYAYGGHVHTGTAAGAVIEGVGADQVAIRGYAGGASGYIYGIDQETGEVVWNVSVGEHKNDELERLPLDTVIEVLPGVYGGVETPMALADGILYVNVLNLPTPYTATAFDAEDGTQAVQNAEGMTDLSTGTAEMAAIDVDTGAILWTTPLESVSFGGATVVNDLVFTSTFDGTVYAISREDGAIVWTYEAPAGINGWPAVAGDTILIPAGVGDNPLLIALRLGATGAVPGELPETGEGTRTPMPGVTATPQVTPTQRVTPTMEVTPTTQPSPTGTPMAEETPEAALTGTPTAGETPEEGDVVEIEVVARAYEFEPSTIEVEAGTPVRFVVTSPDIYHTFTVKESEEAEERLIDLQVFPGRPPVMETYTFEEPGEYYLYCVPHVALGMTGTIVVR
jgi:outer membrane protein assembly factor BamB/plastocyanin